MHDLRGADAAQATRMPTAGELFAAGACCIAGEQFAAGSACVSIIASASTNLQLDGS